MFFFKIITRHIAKRGVGLAIEKDEKEAQKWIDEELKDINYNKYQEEV